MGNPIQYRNTNNPSQIQGGVNENGFSTPPGACPDGGVNENLTPGVDDVIVSDTIGFLSEFS